MQEENRVVKIKETKVIELTWNPNVRCSSPLSEEIEPMKKLHNIMKNAAILPGGSFISGTNKMIIQICDIIGNTLQKTQWIVPTKYFNEMAMHLIVNEKMNESLFYIVSKY